MKLTYTEQQWADKYQKYEGDGSIPRALVLVEWNDPFETPTQAIIRLNDEAVANAKLAPGQPELLAACEEVVESLHVAGYDFTRKTGRMLLAAIAKAKGE